MASGLDRLTIAQLRALSLGRSRGRSPVGGPGGPPPPPPTIAMDGTSGIFLPLIETDFAQMLWSVPDFFVNPAGVLSGNLPEVVHGGVFTPTGSPTYDEAPAGLFASRGVGFTEVAAQGFSQPAGGFVISPVQGLVLYGEFRLRALPTISQQRALLALTGSTSQYISSFQSGSTARLAIRGSAGNVSGTQDYLADARFPALVMSFPGVGVLDHTTSLYSLSTNKESLAGTWPNVPDNAKGIAAASHAGLTPADFVLYCLYGWVGAKAAAIRALGAKTWIQRKGWTVTGY